MSVTRRAFLGGLAATAVSVSALARRPNAPPVIRLGSMANLTHAPMLAGLGSGRFAEALAPFTIETRLFRAGPRVAEALIGNAIDAGTAGPAPLVVHHARHRSLRIVAGVASGGASLVVTKRSGIARASDVRGKRLAVTQLYTTQDIALRAWLKDAGLRDAASGGDVVILAIAGSTILEQMKRGELDGAWLPEPWATRIVQELEAVRLVDERDLWPDGRFATAVLATLATNDHVGRHADWLPKLERALAEEVSRAKRDPAGTIAEAHAELTRRMGNPGSLALFMKASAFVDFTSDPLPRTIERFGESAASLGLCPANPASNLFRDRA